MRKKYGYALDVATTLRENNVNTEVFLEDKKIKAKFKYADKLCIPYVAVLGEEEAKTGKVTLKNMVSGEQKLMNIEDVIKEIR